MKLLPCKTLLLGLGLGCWSALGAEPVKLALILASTGIGADENLPALKSARLAVEEINGSGGFLGRRVELVVLDDASTPLGAKKAAESAVRQGVLGVIGAFRSSHCLAMTPVIREARIPMITPSATNPEVTSGSEYIFRACFTDEVQGKAMAQFAHRDLRAATAVVLTNMTENYCMTLGRTFSSRFTGLGGKVLSEGSYQGNAVDFKAILASLKALRPDVVFIPGYPRDSGLLLSQAVNSGIHTVFLGADAWDMGVDQYAGPALEGAYHSDQWHADAPSARNRALKATYRKKYGRDGFTSMQIPLTYDSIMLFADAVKRANSLVPEKIRLALQQTRGFQGASGSISLDKNRNPIGKDVIIMKFHQGGWNYFKSIGPGR
jgi:branched-chain amino acid transport system substrate-binding protein